MKQPDLRKRLVLLDRDGVLNEDLGDYVCRPADLQVIPSAIRACAQLSQAGIRIGICTNQAGISRGRYTHETLHAIHAKLTAHLHAAGASVQNICYCPSHDNAHPDRKPNAGMLQQQAAFFNLALDGVPFVGDSLSDIQAARTAGALPVLVLTGKGAHTQQNHPEATANIPIYPTLEQAVKQWLG